MRLLDLLAGFDGRGLLLLAVGVALIVVGRILASPTYDELDQLEDALDAEATS